MSEKGQHERLTEEQPPPYNPYAGAPQAQPAYMEKGQPPAGYQQPGYPPQQGGYPQQYQQAAPTYAAGYPSNQGYAYPQGQPQPQGYGQPPNVVVIQQATYVPDHMVFNILVTLFCCWPIGIFAILRSLKVQEANRRGDAAAAQTLSAEAKRLGMWTLGVGIIVAVVSVIIVVVYIALILGSTSYPTK